MAVELSWNNLRPHKGDRPFAFEELCCQLARKEPMPEESVPQRNGTPDGGVECFCRRPDGTEVGWQAKFFLSRLQTSELGQIRDSLKRALQTHPKLAKYVVCVPRNLSDGRGPGSQKTERQRWEDAVARWKAMAAGDGRDLTIELWDETELIARLQKPENRGLFYLWFNKTVFTEDWFKRRAGAAVANAVERYSRELNLEHGLIEFFHALALDAHYRKQLQTAVAGVTEALRSAREVLDEDGSPEETAKTNDLQEILDTLTPVPGHDLPIDEIADRCSDLAAVLEGAERHLMARQPDERGQQSQGASRPASLPGYILSNARWKVRELGRLVTTQQFAAANTQVLVVLGEGGSGKTHLLCDVARRWTENGKPAVLLFGHQLKDQELWQQMARELQLTCGPEELRGALDTAGDLSRQRTLVLIDALNDSEPRSLWKRRLPGLIEDLKNHPNLCLAVSVRTGFEEDVLPEGFINRPDVAVVQHNGFRGMESLAMSHFFNHYGLEAPAHPILYPEFSNPLFLKLLCKGLRELGTPVLPRGKVGLASLVNIIVEGAEKSLSERLGFDPADHLVNKSLRSIATAMVKKATRFIPRSDAKALVDQFLPGRSWANSLFYHLTREGLLGEWPAMDDDEGRVFFGYQKIGDILVAEALLESTDSANPLTCLTTDSRAHRFIGRPRGEGLVDHGVLEVLAVLLPERFSTELPELAEGPTFPAALVNAFIRSLPWRSSESVSERSVDFIRRIMEKLPQRRWELWSGLLTLASLPDHPLNARFLHSLLEPLNMAERDEVWTLSLSRELASEDGQAHRLVEWIFNTDVSAIEKESLSLMAVALCWMFTSNNRRLRDRATKALVLLFEERLDCGTELIQLFRGVDDPYVLERLMAAIYGAAMRRTDCEDLAEVAATVYDRVFADGRPIPHVLLRDYARGIIELALHRGADLEIEHGLIRPPYSSDAPEMPSVELIEALDYWQEGMPDPELARQTILMSTGARPGLSEFGRHVMECALNDWSCRRLDASASPTTGQLGDDFDIEGAKRWVAKRVFDLGWTVERFGRFDREVQLSRYQLDGAAVERIGKKYQWIAFHELLARVADNFAMRETRFGRDKKAPEYEGPWQFGVRDIDPSLVMTWNRPDDSTRHALTCWWSPSAGEALRWDTSNLRTWLDDPDGLADLVRKSLVVTNPKTNEQWAVLDTIRIWRPPPLDDESHENPKDHREVWVRLRAFLTAADTTEALYSKLLGKTSSDSLESFYGLFLGELYWSPAFRWFLAERHGLSDPKEICSNSDALIPAGADLVWDSRQDHSLDETVSVTFPSALLAGAGKLRWNGKDGLFIDADDRLVAQDPSLAQPGPGALVISRDCLKNLLSENNLGLVWLIHGEKWVLGQPPPFVVGKGWLAIAGAARYRPERSIKGEVRIISALSESEDEIARASITVPRNKNDSSSW